MNFQEIYDFSCPRWNELPDEPLFNREAVEWINKNLHPIIDQESRLTTTMVQNYVKWGFLPKEAGRKYSRERIAQLVVLSIYKQVIHLKYVHRGVDLLLNHFPIEQAYNIFCQAVENALKNTFAPFCGENPLLKDTKMDDRKVGLYAVAASFALKLLGEMIIESNGIKNLGENYG